MSRDGGDLIQGTLDMLVLKALQLESMHGWGITERIQQWSQNVLSINQGSLYPSLYRLQRQGWITSEWGVTENGRRARYYQITRSGKKQLDAEQKSWERLSQAVNGILGMTRPEEGRRPAAGRATTRSPDRERSSSMPSRRAGKDFLRRSMASWA